MGCNQPLQRLSRELIASAAEGRFSQLYGSLSASLPLEGASQQHERL